MGPVAEQQWESCLGGVQGIFGVNKPFPKRLAFGPGKYSINLPARVELGVRDSRTLYEACSESQPRCAYKCYERRPVCERMSQHRRKA